MKKKKNVLIGVLVFSLAALLAVGTLGLVYCHSGSGDQPVYCWNGKD